MTFTPIPAGSQNWDIPVNLAFSAQDSAITANSNGIVSNSARLVTLETARNQKATDQGLQAWTFDPVTFGGGNTSTAGTIYMGKVYIGAPTSITNICMYLSTPTAGTAGQNFAGLYDGSGTQLGVTADQTANWTSGIGFRTMPLAGGPVSLNAGFYYVAHVSNSAGTMGFGRASNLATFSGNASAFNLTAATYRYATAGTLQTSLPASITMTGRATTDIQWWYGLS